MRRLPVRWKVTLTFAASLLMVLLAVGAFLYLRFDAQLGEALDRGLRARGGELVALVERSPARPAVADAPALDADESLAQVLTGAGSIVQASSQADFPLLSPAQLRRARARPAFFERPGDERLDEALRMLALPVPVRGETLVVVTAASRDEKDQALSTLLLLELLGLTSALLVASGAGYLVAGVALRPVEAMRRRADEISGQPDRRLPVPPVDDELGRLGATLNAMLDRLQAAQDAEREAIAKERRFVADASHELRTPLTILKSEIEVALLEGGSAAELEAALESTGEETERLIRLAEDLLVLAQSDDGRLPIRPEPFDAAGLLETVAARHRSRPDAHGRRIEVRAPDGTSLTADRLRLEQALSNLVDNALRHGEGDVELTASPAAEGTRLTVRDHGSGFPVAFHSHAFDRFSRADAGRTGAGAGLGLAIVQAVASAHGGSAAVRDARPGACVELTLPSAASSISHPQAAELPSSILEAKE